MCTTPSTCEPVNALLLATMHRGELRDLSLELIEEREMGRRVRLEITKPVSMTLDRTLVKVILSNLLDNANRYSPIGSPITLRIEPKAQQGLDGVTLEVSNLPNPGAVPDADRVFNLSCSRQK